MAMILESLFWGYLEDLDESASFVDDLCVERDTGWTGDPPLSVGAENGTKQTNIIAGYAVASFGIGGIVCFGESGIVCIYPGTNWSRVSGTSTWEYVDWIVALAGTIARVGNSILESEISYITHRVCDIE